MPLPIAEPSGEPHQATIDACRNCGQRIARLHLASARWRHDNGGVTCATDEPPFTELVKGTT